MKTLSTITIFPSNDAELKHYITTLKDEILSGNDDPLKVLKQLKFVEKTISQLLKDKELEDHFYAEAVKYGKTFRHLDTEFSIKEVGAKYDYLTCHDSVWDDLEKRKFEIDAKMKEREQFLKSIPLEGVANALTGEIIYMPLKTSSTKVVVKL
ncbi:MAG: hypothetical protein WC139_13230 [Candidatus Kapaibacterium sp.]